MGYISDFGTGFAARIWGLASFAVLTAVALASGPALKAAETSAGSVTVNISNMRNTKGQLMVCLTANPKAFPDCRKDKNALKKLANATSKKVIFSGVKPGTYAVAIVHDENRNNKMDLAIFMPKEGFAFSRNPAIGMGPPKFKKASFTVSNGNVMQNVRMKYIF